ncbi:ThuA domain-containing protein [Chitinophaga rhizosphaerae]|uniref:ThuA domain-containing protein n=1 Tax=Chitinophaga rhizosphaerae TaxID=1864947 RepID=UPI000F815B76|nr:ThuA domain-containing protein [Chitinophaga rhizosphaerae]
MNSKHFLRQIFAFALLLAALPLAAQKAPLRVLIVGGGGSHDFDRWYKQEDAATLERNGLAKVTYTSDPAAITGLLPETDVLLLANNQPINDPATRAAIFAHAAAGKGLVLAHAAIWYNWKDWPEYNARLVGGGSRSHEKYGPFTVALKGKHPVTRKVPKSFTLDDELYHFNADPAAAQITVLAQSTNDKGVTHPAVFVVEHPDARIVGLALGHDAKSHELAAYQSLLRNAVKWAGHR